jgi:protein-S-isoprenylcysteine O-methyltransferase Ste14
MSSDRDSVAGALPVSSATVDLLGRFVFRYRDYLVPAVLLATLVLSRPHAPLGSERMNVLVDLLGVVIAAAGQMLRVAVIGFAYIQRGGAQKSLSAPKLVRAGFYAHVRNPMYVGDVLLFLGLCLIYNAPFAYLVTLPVVTLSLLTVVHAEERYLGERFGAAYEAYRAEVNRFVPRWRGLCQTVASMRFDWRRVLRKEYGTTFAWSSAAFFLLAWERVVRLGWNAQPAMRWFVYAYLPIPVAYCIVRWLKKTGRLRSPD